MTLEEKYKTAYIMGDVEMCNSIADAIGVLKNNNKKPKTVPPKKFKKIKRT